MVDKGRKREDLKRQEEQVVKVKVRGRRISHY